MEDTQVKIQVQVSKRVKEQLYVLKVREARPVYEIAGEAIEIGLAIITKMPGVIEEAKRRAAAESKEWTDVVIELIRSS